MIWGISSVGRASALQVEGHEFESRILHRSNIVRLGCFKQVIDVEASAPVLEWYLIQFEGLTNQPMSK